MRWTDGSVYKGEWVRGIQHGKGKMIYPDGSVIEGVFANNVYKGPEEPEKVILNPLAATKDLAERLL